MITTIGKLADRLLVAVAPKADAGACPCKPNNWCTSYCGGGANYRYWEACDCTITVTCSCYL